jgi:hypothetical protein
MFYINCIASINIKQALAKPTLSIPFIPSFTIGGYGITQKAG